MYRCSPLWRASLLRIKLPFSLDLGVTSSWFETLNPPAAVLYNERVAADWQLGKANLDWITLWSCFLCGNSNNTQQQIKMDNTIPKFNEAVTLKCTVWLGPFWLCVLKLIWISVTFRVTLSALYNYVKFNRVCVLLFVGFINVLAFNPSTSHSSNLQAVGIRRVHLNLHGCNLKPVHYVLVFSLSVTSNFSPYNGRLWDLRQGFDSGQG
jgi:hypothetical protein